MLNRWRDWFMSQPGVLWVGHGVRDDDGLIRVAVVHPGYAAAVPRQIEGVRVEVVVDTAPTLHSLRGTARPLACGVSIGAREGNKAHSGSVGFFVASGLDVFAVTAGHVWRSTGEQPVSEQACQPSPALAPPGRVVGRLVKRILPGGLMPADAALVELLAHERGALSVVPGAGVTLSSLGRASLGMEVAKAGATTGLTHGSVREVSVAVDFGAGWRIQSGFWVTGRNGRPFSDEGDSGGPVFTPDGRVVGIITGGHGGRTFCSNTQDVALAFGFGAQPTVYLPGASAAAAGGW